MDRTKTDEEDFSEDDKRRDLRAGRNERGGRDWRALVYVRRPEMKRRRRDFERESNQGHDDPDEKQRRQRRADRRDPIAASAVVPVRP